MGTSNLATAFGKLAKQSMERVLRITYYPLAVFRVRPVTRCTSSLSGHTEAVLCISFSPDCTRLASGSGDATVRLWDLNTELPKHTCQGHQRLSCRLDGLASEPTLVALYTVLVGIESSRYGTPRTELC